MFWSHHLSLQNKFSIHFLLKGEGVKPCMHLKEFLCQCFGPSKPPSPVSDWHGRAQARAVAWSLVVGGLDLYYRALGGLTTTSDASRDALQKASDRRTIKQAGSLPPIQNNKTKKKKSPGHRLVLLRSFYQIKYRFWQSEHLTITPWNVSLVFEVTAIYFLPL